MTTLGSYRRIPNATHGTRTGYISGCRCDGCRKADREYKRRWQAERKGKAPETWDEYVARMAAERQEHGIVAYKERGCRCGVCRAANAKEHGEYTARYMLEGRRTEFCEDCERWFTPHGFKCHRTAYHTNSSD